MNISEQLSSLQRKILEELEEKDGYIEVTVNAGKNIYTIRFTDHPPRKIAGKTALGLLMKEAVVVKSSTETLRILVPAKSK